MARTLPAASVRVTLCTCRQLLPLPLLYLKFVCNKSFKGTVLVDLMYCRHNKPPARSGGHSCNCKIPSVATLPGSIS